MLCRWIFLCTNQILPQYIYSIIYRTFHCLPFSHLFFLDLKPMTILNDVIILSITVQTHICVIEVQYCLHSWSDSLLNIKAIFLLSPHCKLLMMLSLTQITSQQSVLVLTAQPVCSVPSLNAKSTIKSASSKESLSPYLIFV